jgi:hypothetical protein
VSDLEVVVSVQQWFILLVTCVVGIVGLFVAAGSEQGTMYAFGLLLFAAAVVCAFRQVKVYFDRLDQARH